MTVEANIPANRVFSSRTNGDLEIRVDQDAREIVVGKWRCKEFLSFSKETDFTIKDEVLAANGLPKPDLEMPSGWDWDENDEHRALWGQKIALAHKHYADLLGAKFYRRLSGASWNLHVAWMPQELWRFVSRAGFHWRQINRASLYAAQRVREHVLQAHADGLDHLVPIVIAFEKSPSEIRFKIGGAVWRRLANNSKSRNHKISQALFSVSMGERAEVCASIIGIKSGNLHLLHLEMNRAELAAHADAISTCDGFNEAMMLVRDAYRMRHYNPRWSLNRLRREHDREAERVATAQHSTKPFCAPHIATVDGFTFTRLISPAEVAKEGHTQRHCVGGYIRACEAGRYAVYKVEGNERATLGLHIRDGMPLGFDQLYGACNSRVSDACRSAAMDLIHDDEFRREWAA